MSVGNVIRQASVQTSSWSPTNNNNNEQHSRLKKVLCTTLTWCEPLCYLLLYTLDTIIQIYVYIYTLARERTNIRVNEKKDPTKKGRLYRESFLYIRTTYLTGWPWCSFLVGKLQSTSLRYVEVASEVHRKRNEVFGKFDIARVSFHSRPCARCK